MMADEELVAIRRIFDALISDINDSERPASGMSLAVAVEQYVPRLLTELEQTREMMRNTLHEVQELRDKTIAYGLIVRQVARYVPHHSPFVCVFCNCMEQHLATCPVTEARKLLDQ